MSDGKDPATLGAEARRLIRTRRQAALGTVLDGRPYVSLVAVACDTEGSPLLLLSNLAQHTRNLQADPHVSLLLDDTAGHADPLAGPRLTLIGAAERFDNEQALEQALGRFVAQHPSARTYVGFGDFHLYRVTIERGHFVAGFGRISWIEAPRLQVAPAPELTAAEADIVAHMNSDHADAVELYATRLLGRAGDGWRITGIDPEGLDLRRGDASAAPETARLDFPEPVPTPAAARRVLASLAQQARAA